MGYCFWKSHFIIKVFKKRKTRSKTCNYDLWYYDCSTNDSHEKTTQNESDTSDEDDLETLLESEKELLETNYGELLYSEQAQVDDILEKVNDYSDDDKKFILKNKERIEKERAEFVQAQEKREAERKEAEEKKKAEEQRQAEERAAMLNNSETYNTGITRDDIARDKSGLYGSFVRFSGKIIQVIEGFDHVEYRLAVDGDYDQIILISIDNKLLDQNILEDDYITIEGMSLGNKTYTTVLGAKQTIPVVEVYHVYFN